MDANQHTTSEQHAAPGLWLTNLWLGLLGGMSSIGKAVIVMAMIIGAIRSFTSLYIQYVIWNNRLQLNRDFYLMEDYNWLYIFNTLSIFAIIYLYFRGMQEGFNAFRLFQYSSTDDDALLEGQERLGMMFKWLTWWAGLYILIVLLDFLVHYL